MALTLALLPAPGRVCLPDDAPSRGGEKPAGASEKPPAGEAKKDDKDPGREPQKRKKTKVIIRDPKEKGKAPPRVVVLPKAGSYRAEDLLSLAGVLTGLTVQLESDRVLEVEVKIDRTLASERVGLVELTVLLAAHGLYLFRIPDAKEGELLVASRNPSWHEEDPSYTKVIEAAPGDFAAVWKAVEREVEARNAKLPKDAPRITAVSSARTGKVFIRAWRPEDLTAIEKAAAGVNTGAAEKEAERPHLYTHLGRFRKAEELKDEALERLQPGERNLVHVVVSAKGNRLLYRAPAALGEKLKGILEELDVRPRAPPAGR